jgi:decaprenyl-phosphate phosphoribosyltransferase
LQWTKNVVLLAALVFDRKLFEPGAVTASVVAVLVFCGLSSGVYLINDVRDVAGDRLHPVKRRRPVASGIVPVGLATALGVVLVAGGIGVGFLAGGVELPAVVAGYVALTTAYSLGLKSVAVVDLVCVAAGFVLRAVAGAVATDVPISDWFFIVASFGSLFMVAGKRRAEQVDLGELAAGVRPTLGAYSPSFLNYLSAVSSGTVLVAYCLWAFERAEEVGGGFPWYQVSILPFVMGILRYALLLDAGRGAAPEDVVLGDRALQVIGVAWAICFGAGVYVLHP